MTKQGTMTGWLSSSKSKSQIAKDKATALEQRRNNNRKPLSSRGNAKKTGGGKPKSRRRKSSSAASASDVSIRAEFVRATSAAALLGLGDFSCSLLEHCVWTLLELTELSSWDRSNSVF